MALYGQSADGIREDLGLLSERIKKLEGNKSTGGGGGAAKPVSPPPPVGDELTAVPAIAKLTKAPTKDDFNALISALKLAGVFK